MVVGSTAAALAAAIRPAATRRTIQSLGCKPGGIMGMSNSSRFIRHFGSFRASGYSKGTRGMFPSSRAGFTVERRDLCSLPRPQFPPAAAWRKPCETQHRFSSSSFFDKLKQKAESATKRAAEQATEVTKATARKASEQAKAVAQETLEKSQKAARQATDEALQQVSKQAAKATQASKETLTKAASTATKATSEAITNSTLGKATTKLGQNAAKLTRDSTAAVQTGAHKAQQTARGVAESSRNLSQTLTNTGTKALRWFWWWSLAAIFVYGVASTLPMAIIKYTIEEKKKSWQQTTTGADNNSGDESAAAAVPQHTNNTREEDASSQA